jgi:hypothetical protein
MISFNNIVLPDDTWRAVFTLDGDPASKVDLFPSSAHAYAFAVMESKRWEKRDSLLWAFWAAVERLAWNKLVVENK